MLYPPLYPSLKVLATADEPLTCCFIIAEGSVSLSYTASESGPPVVIHRATGDFFGMFLLLHSLYTPSMSPLYAPCIPPFIFPYSATYLNETCIFPPPRLCTKP